MSQRENDLKLYDPEMKAKDGKNGFAVAALLLGIIALLTGSGVFVVAILAIIFARISRDKDTKIMCGKAKVGMILGIVSIVLFVVALVGATVFFFLFIDALKKAFEGIGQGIGDALNQSIQDALS